MRFARFVFLVAGIYGLAILLPQYFLEARLGQDYPPPITHAEYFYGFLGVAVAWQVVFIFLSTDPVRYRLMMIPAMIEKATYVIAVALLYSQGRASNVIVGTAVIDGTLGILFLVSYLKTAPGRS